MRAKGINARVESLETPASTPAAATTQSSNCSAMFDQYVHLGPNSTFLRAKALMLSIYLGRCFPAYGRALLGPTEGLFYHSPHILERKFRNGIEYYQVTHVDGWEEYRLTSTSISALLDSLEQVRDVVGRFCDTLAHTEDYTSWSPLYSRFRDIGMTYPLEPIHAFDMNWWSGAFSSERELQEAVIKVQIWGMWMIGALHCLSMYEGKCHSKLPHLTCAHIFAAQQAWQAEEKAAGRMPNSGALNGWHSFDSFADDTSMVSYQENDSDTCLETASAGSSSSGSLSLRRRASF